MTAVISDHHRRACGAGDVRNGLFEEGHIALQFGVGTVKFRKVEIKPL